MIKIGFKIEQARIAFDPLKMGNSVTEYNYKFTGITSRLQQMERGDMAHQ
jgi:hypothetical protein